MGEAGFEIGFSRLDIGRRTVDIHIVIRRRAIIVDDARIGHLVETGEEGEIHVRDVERRAVERRNGEGKTGEGIFDPNAVLEQERHQAEREGQVNRGIFAGETRIDRAAIALEEECVEIAVSLDFAFPVRIVVGRIVAEKFAARKLALAVERPHDCVNTFRRGETVVEIEIEPRRHLADFHRAIVVEGDRRAPIAINIELVIGRIERPQEGARFAQGAGGVKFAARFDQRAGCGEGRFAAIDLELRIGIVAGIFIGGIRLKHASVMLDLARRRIGDDFIRGRDLNSRQRHGAGEESKTAPLPWTKSKPSLR